MSKCKSRYILGEGFPWALGTKDYTDICLAKSPVGLEKVEIKFPEELWTEGEAVPKYRLILEKIDDE